MGNVPCCLAPATRGPQERKRVDKQQRGRKRKGGKHKGISGTRGRELKVRAAGGNSRHEERARGNGIHSRKTEAAGKQQQRGDVVDDDDPAKWKPRQQLVDASTQTNPFGGHHHEATGEIQEEVDDDDQRCRPECELGGSKRGGGGGVVTGVVLLPASWDEKNNSLARGWKSSSRRGCTDERGASEVGGKSPGPEKPTRRPLSDLPVQDVTTSSLGEKGIQLHRPGHDLRHGVTFRGDGGVVENENEGEGDDASVDGDDLESVVLSAVEDRGEVEERSYVSTEMDTDDMLTSESSATGVTPSPPLTDPALDCGKRGGASAGGGDDEVIQVVGAGPGPGSEVSRVVSSEGKAAQEGLTNLACHPVPPSAFSTFDSELAAIIAEAS